MSAFLYSSLPHIAFLFPPRPPQKSYPLHTHTHTRSRRFPFKRKEKNPPLLPFPLDTLFSFHLRNFPFSPRRQYIKEEDEREVGFSEVYFLPLSDPTDTFYGKRQPCLRAPFSPTKYFIALQRLNPCLRREVKKIIRRRRSLLFPQHNLSPAEEWTAENEVEMGKEERREAFATNLLACPLEKEGPGNNGASFFLSLWLFKCFHWGSS